jgi:hypothetical protein
VFLLQEWQYPPHQRQGSYEEEGRAVNHLKVLYICFCASLSYNSSLMYVLDMLLFGERVA